MKIAGVAPTGRVRFILSLLAPLLISVPANAQLAQIPFTRNDSAQIAENDSLYAKFYAQGNLMEASRQLDQKAILMWKHNYLQQAVNLFRQSLKHNEALGNQNGIAGINSNLAFIYTDLQQYDTAFRYFEMTLAVRRAAGKPVGIISTLVNQSVVLNHLRRFSESTERLEEALRLAREMNDETQMRSVYGMLSETWQKAGNSEKAMYYYGYYKTFNDYVTQKQVETVKGELEMHRLAEENLRLENQNKELQLERQQWQLSQQALDLSLLTAEQKRLLDSLSAQEMINQILIGRNEQQMLRTRLLVAEKQRIRALMLGAITLAVLIGAFLLVVLVMLRHRNRLNQVLRRKNETITSQTGQILAQNDELHKVNELLTQKNSDILSSISYSKQVQSAVIQHNTPLNEIFSSAFLLQSPLAIVSGDFYYCRRTPQGNRLLVVADCTGHGVPGAFLTIFATAVLDRAVFDKKLPSCNEILNELDLAFSDLNRHDNLAIHSMDLAVCLVQDDQKRIEFAGVQNGLFIVQDGETQFVKGCRCFIGNRYSPFPNTHSQFAVTHIDIDTDKPAWCYMFSDGISDQFAPNGKKFSTQRLCNILKDNAHLPAEEQLGVLTSEIKVWQDGGEQTDDMILIGFQIP